MVRWEVGYEGTEECIVCRSPIIPGYCIEVTCNIYPEKKDFKTGTMCLDCYWKSHLIGLFAVPMHQDKSSVRLVLEKYLDNWVLKRHHTFKRYDPSQSTVCFLCGEIHPIEQLVLRLHYYDMENPFMCHKCRQEALNFWIRSSTCQSCGQVERYRFHTRYMGNDWHNFPYEYLCRQCHVEHQFWLDFKQHYPCSICNSEVRLNRSQWYAEKPQNIICLTCRAKRKAEQLALKNATKSITCELCNCLYQIKVSHKFYSKICPRCCTSDRGRLYLQVSNHLNRAKLAGTPATLTLEEWVDTLHHFKNQCAYCRKSHGTVLEHFISISAGGGTSKDNCIPACPSCNAKKHSIKGERLYQIFDKLHIRKIENYLKKQRVINAGK